MEQLVLLNLSIVKVSSARSDDYFLVNENVSNFSFFLFYFFALKSSYLQVFTNLYYLICIFSSRLIVFCEYLIILAQRGKNRSGD